MHHCIQNSGVPTHHHISERVAQAQDCHENTGENVSHLPPPDLQQSTCTVWYESLCKQEQQKAEAQQKSENVFFCTHFKSCKTVFFAFCLTRDHWCDSKTSFHGISSSFLTESNFKDWEVCRDTLKHCVFIATTIRNLYSVKAVHVHHLSKPPLELFKRKGKKRIMLSYWSSH